MPTMLTLFSEVDRPLEPAEVDANFTGLDSRVRDMETNGVRAVGIEDIVFNEGKDSFLVLLTDGQTYGPFNLPTTFFVPRGEWVAGTAYQQRDYVTVTVAGASYVCRGAHKASADFATDLANNLWQINSKRGDPGLDGKPFTLYRGVYDPTKAYLAGDSVIFGTNYVLYRATVDAPAGSGPGTLQPGTPVPYWTLQSVPPGTSEIHVNLTGKLVPNTLLFRRRFARPIQFPTNLAGSLATLGVATTATLTIQFYKNGVGFASATFAAGSKTSTLAMTNTPLAPVSFASGDVLHAVVTSQQPAPDSTASDLDMALVGTLLQG